MARYLAGLLAFPLALSLCIAASAQGPSDKDPVAVKPEAKAVAPGEPVRKGAVAPKGPAGKEPAAKSEQSTAPKQAKKAPAGERDFKAVEALKASGFKTCADTVGEVLKFLHKKDDFAYINIWSDKKPADTHTASIFTVKTYSDGNSYASVTVSPRQDGGCDAGFTQVFFFYETCSTMRNTVFRDWNLSLEYNEVAVYEDPTSKNVVISLTPTARGCLVVKNGTFYFPERKKS
jgi:hypothetical protein